MSFKIRFPWNRHKVFRALGFFPVAFTLGLMLWSAFVYALSVIPLVARSSRLLAALCSVFTTALWVLTTWSYVNCVFLSPGAPAGLAAPGDGSYTRVPAVNGTLRTESNDSQHYADYSDDSEYSDDEGPLTEEQVRRAELVYSITVRDNGQPRFCLKCNGPKPDRTHHCSVCGSCVLKMDHHCPWLNNCVGFRTQKAFVLFLTYGCLYCVLIFVPSVTFFFREMAELSDDTEISINFIFLVIMSCVFALALLMFAAYHVYLLLTNTTTIESYEKTNYRVEARQRGTRTKYINLFDMGPRKNFIQVFGSSWFMWLVPTNTAMGDGMRFPISFEGYNELRQNID
ncbi:palmitoyltransferase for Vac8p [Coemansia aciculifera]|uniref:Palmitoyltransferase n=1 Tax=Coemansia aciculifera TaxID=417176 RepID=A0A9W8IEM6_9FUNG|nr:palmitoyltransferase for Vac8p [Coemansia aciculifera]